MRSGGFFMPVALLVLVTAAILAPRAGVRQQRASSTTQTAASQQPSSNTSISTDVELPETLLARFLGLDQEAQQFRQQPLTKPELLKQIRTSLDEQGYSLDTLLVTLPDPIDSNARWLFDPLQVALQAAVAQNGYVLDRFYIPDWKPSLSPAESNKDRGRQHESYPGLILFRKDSPEGKRGLLLVFLLFETPTQGLHLAPLQLALDFLHRWEPQGTSPIKILGPTFSGTSASLRIGLRHAADLDLLGNSPVRVVSGSAMSSSNRDIEAALPKGQVSYRATVVSNGDLLLAMIRHLTKTTGLKPEQLALLVEENTVFGSSIGAYVAELSRGGLRGVTVGEAEQPLSDALFLYFPLHVSRVRGDSDDDRGEAPASANQISSAIRALSLRPERQITDQLPLFGEETSPAYVELALSNIFATIRREHVTTVGLIATDTRDKLYLSRLLRRYCPTVRQFTIETDLLYTHPDYGADMRGALVASTYPLHSANQLWSRPFAGEHRRFQFSMGGAEGIYNAARVLLNSSSQPSSRSVTIDTRTLLEYGSPLQTVCDPCRPPVWISVVGRGALWPLAIDDRSSDYVLNVHNDSKPTNTLPNLDRRRMLPIPLLSIVWVFLLHLLGVVHAVPRAFGRRIAGTFARHTNRQRYLVGSLVALFLMLSFCDLLVWIWSGFVFPTSPLQRWLTRTAVLIPIMVLVALFQASRRISLVAQDREPARWPVNVYRALLITVVGLSAITLFSAIGPLYVDSWRTDWQSAPNPQLVLFVERSAQVTNGVSPAVPVMFLCGALYLWGFQHFRRRGVLSGTTLRNRMNDLERLRASAIPARTRGDRSVVPLERSLPRFRLLRVRIFALALAVQVVWYFHYPKVSTIDSLEYTWFFRVVSILLQALIAVAIADFLFAWSKLRHVLERMAEVTGVTGSLGEAFARLPSSLRGLGVFARVPRVAELEAAVVRAIEIETASLECIGVPEGLERLMAHPPEFTASDGDVDASRVPVAFERDRADPTATYSDSKTWQELVAFTCSVRRRALEMTHLVGPHTSTALTQWLKAVDDLFALNLVLIARELSGRLIASILLTTAMTLLTLGSHTFYPAAPRQLLLGFSWACIVGCVLASTKVFVQMDKNEILSYVAGTTPNKTEWNVAFVAKFAVWVLLPLASLFAAQFPEIGGAVVGWLQPVQKALP